MKTVYNGSMNLPAPLLPPPPVLQEASEYLDAAMHSPVTSKLEYLQKREYLLFSPCVNPIELG